MCLHVYVVYHIMQISINSSAANDLEKKEAYLTSAMMRLMSFGDRAP